MPPDADPQPTDVPAPEEVPAALGAPLALEVPAALDGQRVDRAVALISGGTRRQVASWIDQGRVRLDGRVVSRASTRVGLGAKLVVDRRGLDGPGAPPQADPSVEFQMVYADDQVIVVNKPAGLVVHPGAGHPGGTLVNGLLARFPDLAAWTGTDRPGIVHRLDRGTSGLLVVARDFTAGASLTAQLAARTVSRRYQALVAGVVEEDEGTVDAPIGRAARRATVMAVSADGRAARTHFRVEDRYRAPSELTRLDCRLETGRTHQIRVHLAAIGYPVVGDDRYGRRGPRLARELGLAPGRLWLHAGSLAFDHPRSGQRISFSAELPEDLAGSIRRLA